MGIVYHSGGVWRGRGERNHICICIHTHKHAYMYSCSMHIHIYVHIGVHIYTYIYIYIYIYKHIMFHGYVGSCEPSQRSQTCRAGLAQPPQEARRDQGKVSAAALFGDPAAEIAPPPLPLLCRTQLAPLFPAGWGRGAPAAARDTPPRQRVPMQSRPLQEKSESEESEAKPPSELLPGGPTPAVVAKAMSEAKAETNLQLSAAKRLSKQPRHESALWANRVAAPCTAQPGAPESGTRKDSQTKKQEQNKTHPSTSDKASSVSPSRSRQREPQRFTKDSNNSNNNNNNNNSSAREKREKPPNLTVSQGAVRSEGRCLLLGALTKHF